MKTLKTDSFEFNTGDLPVNPSMPTLLFIHGASLSKGIWDAQIDGLNDIANTFAIDLPGHGGSDGPGCDTITGYSDAVHRFILSAGIPQNSLILCGMSMGGAIVQHMLVEHPKTCQAGILINTGARLKVLPMIFESVTNDFAGFINSTPVFSLSPKTDTQIFKDHILDFSGKCDVFTALNDFRACNGFDMMDKIQTVTHPVLVLSAEHDLSTPPKYGYWLAEHIINAEHVHITNAGHFSPLEKADEINEAIRQFLIKLKR
jgi:pimeloyl-ACP methyl ester carboxylesterase